MKKNLRVILNMSSLSVPDKINKATIIIASVSTNTGVFSSPSPSLSIISNAINDLKIAWTESVNGRGNVTALLQEKENRLLKLMCDLAHYVKIVANGDENIIRMAGLKVKQIPKRI